MVAVVVYAIDVYVLLIASGGGDGGGGGGGGVCGR